MICSLSRETISLICWNMVCGRDPTVSPKELLHLARTSRYLSEPALDVIWHTLPSIWPLLLLLPKDLFLLRHIEIEDENEEEFSSIYKSFFEYDRGRWEFTFLREPILDDFLLWTKYSSRVRSVDPDAMRDFFGFLSSDAVNTLQHHCPKPFLPKLAALSYSERTFSKSDSVSLPASFHFAPNLKVVDLTLVTHPNPDHLHDIINDMALLAPHVEELSLFRYTHHYFLSRKSKTYRPCLRGIETSQLCCLTSFHAVGLFVAFDALLGLGRLLHLRELVAQPQIERRNWDDAFPQGRRDGFFPALQQLKLDGTHANHECCIALVSAIAATSLYSVVLDLRWPRGSPAEALFTALCAALGGIPSPDTLQEIKISLGRASFGDGNIYHSACFEPLLSLGALRSLHVDGGPKVVVDDAMLDAMSRAWPAIRTLRFVWSPVIGGQSDPFDWHESGYRPPAPDAPDRPRATLAGLVPLALRCADLDDLEVAIDMRVVPSFDNHQRPPVFLTTPNLCKVKTLQTAGCVPGDPWAVAMFLSLVLPQLHYINSSPPYYRWEKVQDYHAKLTALRWQERGWGFDNGKDVKTPVYP